jgi:hypothetical protein
MRPTVVAPEVQSWRKKYLFLPKWLRDFHAQKDLFKTIHESVDISKAMPYDERVNWTVAMCYVIDVFLWFMARHGYTLQKTRTKLDFNDLDETLNFWEEKRRQDFADMLNNRGK